MLPFIPSHLFFWEWLEIQNPCFVFFFSLSIFWLIENQIILQNPFFLKKKKISFNQRVVIFYFIKKKLEGKLKKKKEKEKKKRMKNILVFSYHEVELFPLFFFLS